MEPSGSGGGGEQEGVEGCCRGKWARLEMRWIKMEEKEVKDASEFLACVTGWKMGSLTDVCQREPGLRGGLLLGSWTCST